MWRNGKKNALARTYFSPTPIQVPRTISLTSPSRFATPSSQVLSGDGFAPSVLLSAQHNRLRVRAVTMRKRIGPSLKLNLKCIVVCIVVFVCVCVVLVKDYMFKCGVPPTRFCTTFTPQPPSWDTDLPYPLPCPLASAPFVPSPAPPPRASPHHLVFVAGSPGPQKCKFTKSPSLVYPCPPPFSPLWVLYDLLFFRVLLSQSSPSYRPSPVVAHVAWMYLSRGRGKTQT